MRPVLLALVLVAAGAAQASPLACNGGVVYEDRDRDNRYGAGDVPLPGIAVSDGEWIVRSDAQGRYRLPLRSGRSVFVIKPESHDVPVRADGVPDSWRNLQAEPGPPLRYGGVPVQAPACRDFALWPRVQSNRAYDVLVFGDPQPRSAADVDYYARDIVAPLVGRHEARLGISLGDEVSDDLSLYPAMNAATARLGVPWLHVAGNHDLDFDAPRDEDSLQTFRRHYGPDTFAWEEPGARFIVLDNVVYRPGQSPAYIGGLREEQFAFLEAYLPSLPREALLVIAAHIPFFDTAPEPERETFRSTDRERLFALLRDFPHVLLLTAHGHLQRRHYHGEAEGWRGTEPLHEYNIGATCGAYWSGAADAEGIPDATMNDGTPNGYAVLGVAPGGRYTLAYRVARLRLDPGLTDFTDFMALHAPRVLRRGAYPAFGVFANVFMGHAGTRVEYRVDEGEWQPMRRVERADPRLQIENAVDDLETHLRGYDRSPEAIASSHLWRGTLPTDLATGEHRVEVRVFDDWHGVQTASTRYRLEEAQQPR